MAVITKKQEALEYLIAEGISAPHCFTTRFGGVSQGALSSMNIGTHRGDSVSNVLQNYDILCGLLGTDRQKLILTHQTHTDLVLPVDDSHWGAGLERPELPECDGLITNTPGTALVVFTADCTPILLHDPVTGAVGAVHAGWRGTANAIAGKAVEKMCKYYGCRPENIHGAIGPNIGLCCFETHEDVPAAMLEAFGQAARPYIRKTGDKYRLDLKQINALALRNAGVIHIEVATECTKCQCNRFWSHRVTGGERGSQGAVILCQEAGK